MYIIISEQTYSVLFTHTEQTYVSKLHRTVRRTVHTRHKADKAKRKTKGRQIGTNTNTNRKMVSNMKEGKGRASSSLAFSQNPLILLVVNIRILTLSIFFVGCWLVLVVECRVGAHPSTKHKAQRLDRSDERR